MLQGYPPSYVATELLTRLKLSKYGANSIGYKTVFQAKGLPVRLGANPYRHKATHQTVELQPVGLLVRI